MQLAFLLMVHIIIPGDGEIPTWKNVPLDVLETRAECVANGEAFINQTNDSLDRAGKTGAGLWYSCREVQGYRGE